MGLKMRTRVKFCGLSSEKDIHDAVYAGADAIGLVLYEKSKRYVPLTQAAALRRTVPAFVNAVTLTVNADVQTIEQIMNVVQPDFIQFHGDETADFCEQFSYPYIRALRVGAPGLALPEEIATAVSGYPNARAFLFDAYSPAYGGAGISFDIGLLAQATQILPAHKIMIAGGLNASNIAALVSSYHPYAVDLSSGIEIAPGEKSAGKMRSFMLALSEADKLHWPVKL
ncbi:MAG TPA: N-(5'-phosphoribosyl)anthranilate isomerase [Advenella kashmirensis]|uniref:N-(5'-phosphoribosyl)anthranilate isomerase n=1 Tax=Advenella kashmirensis TaxID=310575 RepID=A0A356LC46_9BURK|nr:N-(5'-phosphoribosyl)anthranilate isomerase [Advenella kashmirensis]